MTEDCPLEELGGFGNEKALGVGNGKVNSRYFGVVCAAS